MSLDQKHGWSKEQLLLQYTERLAKTGTWQLDLATQQLYWSDGVYFILEYEAQEFPVSFDKGLSYIHQEDREAALQTMQRAIDNGQEYNIQKRFVTKTGKIKHIRSTGTVIKDEQNKPIKLVGVFQDITEQVLADEQQHALIQSIDGIVWEADANTLDFLYVSPQVERILGYTPEEWMGQKDFWQQHIHPDEKEEVIQFCLKETAQAKDHVFEYRMRAKNGEYHWLQDRVSVVLEHGVPAKLRGLLVDITLQKTFSEKLLEEKMLNESLIQHLPNAFFLFDKEGRLLIWNQALEKASGYSGEEVARMNPLSFFDQAERELVEESIQTAFRTGGVELEAHILNRDQQKVPFYFLSKRINYKGQPCIYGIGVDISKSRQNLLEINMMLDNTEESFVLLDRNLDIVSFNRQFTYQYAAYFGVHVQRGDSILNYALPERREALKALYTNVLEGNTQVAELNLTTTKGEAKTFYLKYKPAVGNNGAIEGVFVIAADITEKKKAEALLQQSEQRFRSLVQEGSDLIAILDADGIYKYVSPTSATVLGISPEFFVGRLAFDFIHPEDQEMVTAHFSRLGQERRIHIPPFRLIHQDGSWHWIETVVTNMLEEPSVAGIVANSRDVTEMREMQLLLNNATQLARVGGWSVDLLTETYYWSPMTREIHEAELDFVPDGQNTLHFFKEEAREEIISVFKQAIEVGSTIDIEQSIITAKGNDRWVRIIGNTEFLNGQCVRIFGSFQDITKRKLAEIALSRKTELLSAVARVITLFLTSEDWYASFHEGLKIAGEAVQADRVYYFERHPEPVSGKWVFSQRLEWNSGVSAPQIDNPQLQNIDPEAFSEFFSAFEQENGFSAIVSAMPEGELKQTLLQQNIRSALVLPVRAGATLTGFIGLDDCTRERSWEEDEIFFLSSIASNLSAALQRRKSQLELEAAFEEKNTILESIGDGFITVDHHWAIQYWNKEAEQILGQERSKVLGKNLWEVFEDAVDTVFFEEFNIVMTQKTPAHFEAKYLGLNMWVDVSAYPNEKGISIYFKNITERKLAEEQIRSSNERFAKIAQATNDAIWDWDIENETLYWGEAYRSLFGYDISKAAPGIKEWTSYIHPEDMATVQGSLESILADPLQTKWEKEYRYKKADGTFAYVIDRGLIIRNSEGKALRMVGAMGDITHRREYQASLEKLNEILEARARELAISNAELEQFAFVASHDLQEPLRMVTSFLTQLEKKYGTVLDEKARQYIHYAVDGAKRMRQIILDLLEFSRVGKQEEERQELSLRQIIDEVCQLQRKAITEKQALIHYGELPWVHSFKTPLLQVFQNLIGNALKYSQPGIPPEIWIEAEEKGHYYQVSVRDNGIGIETEYFDKIFTIFQRLHSKDEYSGTGMGLSIVKKIIERLGGQIWVDSGPNKGSTFYFTLSKSERI